MQDVIMELYNQGHSLKYIIDFELRRLRDLKFIHEIDFIPTPKIARENVEHTIYENLMISKGNNN